MNNGWHISKSVTLSHILATILLLVSAMATGAALYTRVSVLEVRQEDRDRHLNGTIDQIQTDIREIKTILWDMRRPGAQQRGANVKIIRLNTLTSEEAEVSTDHQRMGVMVCARKVLCTVEKPWLPNEHAPDGIGAGVPYQSCVPLGEYELVQRQSPSKGLKWHFHNPDLGLFLDEDDCTEDWHRFSCMFHVANWVENVVGCAGVGLDLFKWPDGRVGVRSSAIGLVELEQFLKGETNARLVIQ